MKIFSGSANKPLADKIATALGIKVSPLEIHIFPDGEKRVRVEESIVGKDCIIVQPTNPPADVHYMELFFIVDAIVRSGAKSAAVVVPYIGYQRQDHVFRSGEAVSLAVIIKTLVAVGISKIITVDLHSVRIVEAFTIAITHLSALPLFVQKIKAQGWVDNDTMLISPDMGGKRRIKLVSDMLGGMQFGAIEKNRDLVTGSVTAYRIVTSFWGAQATPESDSGQARMTKSEQVVELKGRRAIIIDDMISSGKTIETAANLLKKKGVEEIFVFATHPVFSDDAPNVLQHAPVEKVFVTDSIYVPKEKYFPKLEIISVVDIIANAL